MSLTNICPNPSCKNDTTGWSSSTTFVRATDINGHPRATGIKMTGQGFMQTPTAPCSPGDVISVSFFITNNSDFSMNGKIAYMSYTRDGQSDVYPQTFSIPDMPTTGTDAYASFTANPAPAGTTGVYLIIDGINASNGNGAWISSVQYQIAGSVAPYFDGDSTNAVWNGTAGNSSSTYTAGATSNLFTTQLPSSGAEDIFETVPVTVGTKFYVTKDGATLLGGGFYGPATIGAGTFQLRAFEQSSPDSGSATGLYRMRKDFGSLTPSVWNPLLFDGPIPLIKNKIYCLAVATSQGRYAAVLNGFLSGQIANGNIVGPQTNTDPVGSGNVYNGVFTSGLVNYPNNTYNGHAYMVDPIIEFPPATYDPKAAAFFAFL